jgi:hypothetical protein
MVSPFSAFLKNTRLPRKPQRTSRKGFPERTDLLRVHIYCNNNRYGIQGKQGKSVCKCSIQEQHAESQGFKNHKHRAVQLPLPVHVDTL